MNRTIPLEVRPEQESEPQARHKSPSDSECKGALERFSLGHELVTDVVRLQFSDLCDEWDAYSVAYAVLLGAATTLDVPDTDLNATIARFEHEFLDDGFDEPTPDAEQVKLLSHFPRARSCVYWYDYGDDWMHTVRLRGRASSSERFHRRLLAGRRACPPEDCGGVYGYHRFVSIIEEGDDPWDEDEDVAELLEWVGNWDPSAFDLKDRKRTFDAVQPSSDWF